jgi:pimeloyl-ACP methyl ester carboxylesterase
MSSATLGSGDGGVDVTGPDDGEDIVLVHGTVFNRTMWAPQRRALTDEFRVVAPDLPGHGSRDDERFDLESGVATLERTVEEHVDGSAHLVGLSLGGYVATAFASRNPGRVDDLVLSSSSANPVGLLGALTRVLGEVSLRASGSGLVERATDWLAARYVRNREIDRTEADEVVDAGFDLRPFGEAGVSIAGEDFRAALADYPGRTLLLNGKWDLVMRLGEDEHAASARDADVRVLDGAGHVCNLDRAERYTSALERFVAPTTKSVRVHD